MSEPSKSIEPRRSSTSFSIASILAVLAAVGSFYAGAIFGLILALVAILFGLVGVIIALSPAKRGGIASTFAVIAGLVGIIAAIIKFLGWFV